MTTILGLAYERMSGIWEFRDEEASLNLTGMR